MQNRQQESLLYHYTKQDAMKDLVGNITHQWKQPVNELSSVLFYIETKLQLKQKITQDDISDAVFQAREIINYLSKTVSTFSNFYDTTINKNEVCILALIKQAIYITEGSFQKYKIDLNLNTQEKNFKIMGEEFQQVILAILNNIQNVVIERNIKNPLILIRLYRNKDLINLEIEDNCGGIHNKDIFNLGKTSTKKGTGLGLYISKRIIEDKYKGKITFYNSNKGVIFKITIPSIDS